jgi:hypothetical protein
MLYRLQPFCDLNAQVAQNRDVTLVANEFELLHATLCCDMIPSAHSNSSVSHPTHSCEPHVIRIVYRSGSESSPHVPRADRI